jgi:hypothetical protein
MYSTYTGSLHGTAEMYTGEGRIMAESHIHTYVRRKYRRNC